MVLGEPGIVNGSFPDGFVWGTTSSSYQIEGGRHEDGKGDSIWDRFADEGRMPETGDVACDHYHRWQEDVALMADLGVTAYCFSVSWPRVIPDGDGAVNPAGLRFYERLVDELLAHGIAPWPTLFHWELPQSLQDRGGWANRATVDAFARYAEVVSATLGSRAKHWVTHNEPWVAAFLGHLEGVFAPGLRDWNTALVAAHHLLLSHGRAVQEIRGNVDDAVVGIALDCRPSRPATTEPADLDAQRHFDGFRNRWIFDPLFGKGYPVDMVAAYQERGRIPPGGPAFVRPGDTDTIAEPLDFLGLNYYTSLEIGAGHEESEDTGVLPSPNPPAGHTEMGWPITPDALADYLHHVYQVYRPARIVITENGVSCSIGPSADGRVRDQPRIDYLRRHLSAVRTAIDGGVPVAGYFVWSLLDNLEWVLGYSQRFGLVWVDHTTGARLPKDSFSWLREVIADAR